MFGFSLMYLYCTQYNTVFQNLREKAERTALNLLGIHPIQGGIVKIRWEHELGALARPCFISRLDGYGCYGIVIIIIIIDIYMYTIGQCSTVCAAL